MIILVPWFGDVDRFRPLAESWARAHKESGTKALFAWLTDSGSPHLGGLEYRYDLAVYQDVIRPGQPFDVKGALVCSALLQLPGEILVLDLDARLRRDPEPMLRDFWKAHPMGMPFDDGSSMHGREKFLLPPFGDVLKCCAGVLWFDEAWEDVTRAEIVERYRAAFREFAPTLPWLPQLPHLVEQNAWSEVRHRVGGAILPRALNWSPDHLGHHPGIYVEHRYGLRKWW